MSLFMKMIVGDDQQERGQYNFWQIDMCLCVFYFLCAFHTRIGMYNVHLGGHFLYGSSFCDFLKRINIRFKCFLQPT